MQKGSFLVLLFSLSPAIQLFSPKIFRSKPLWFNYLWILIFYSSYWHKGQTLLLLRIAETGLAPSFKLSFLECLLRGQSNSGSHSPNLSLRALSDMPGAGSGQITTFNAIFLLSISLCFLLFLVSGSQIPLGSKLSVEENNHWVSSNGDFAIGFINSSNQHIVGIHFNSISIPATEQKVVWVAGADLRVGSRSYFQLTGNGELVLFDSAKGVIAWTSNTSNLSVESMILRDDGDLVLVNRDNAIVWQSFDTPSDTLLPGQNFSVSQVLRPPRRNSVSSYYTLHMDVSGQLQLRWETSIIYWSSGNSPQMNLRAILGSDGVLQLLDQKSEHAWSVYGEDHHDLNILFRFLRLDIDGNLRLYSWSNELRSWRSVWQALENQCDVFATCGVRGICVLDASGSHGCRCPFTSTRDLSSNCLIPYEQDCRSGSSMITYEQTLFYGVYPPNETVIHASFRNCKSSCKEDPLCFAVSFINDGTAQCRMIKTRYISGKSDPSLSSTSSVKTCSDPLAALPIVPDPPSSPTGNTSAESSKSVCIPCVVGVSSSTFALFLAIQFGIGLYIYRGRKYATKRSRSDYLQHSGDACIKLSYSEITDLTENFKHQIGPKMFKGVLPNSRVVAVKVLNKNIAERKFRTTVLTVGSLYHKNLAKLEGYCCESEGRLIVYEFAAHSSLDKSLKNPDVCRRLTWEKRIEICLSVAKAVSYLHTGCREFIGHGNLKCTNVVLDDNLEAKVSEFGLRSVLHEGNESEGPAGIDVRDFGMLVLELISGCESALEVCKMVYEKWVKGETEMVVDSRIEGGIDYEELERVLRIAFWCVQADERMRPSMAEVVMVLDGTLSVDSPPSPFAPILRSPLSVEPSVSSPDSYQV